jgi:O-antigen/teichoic acid export membrane protein
MLVNNSFYRSIIQLVSINTLSYLVMFLSSVIVFRTVDKSFYGLYVIILSLFAITELLMAGLNDCIVRFLKDKIPLQDKQGIILFVLYIKYLLILLFIIFIYFARKWGFFEFLIGNFKDVSTVLNSFLAVVVLNGIISNFISVNNSILNSQLKYKFVARIDLARNFISLMVVFLLSFYTTNYLNYLLSYLFLNLVVLLFLFYKIKNDFNQFSVLKIIKVKTTFSVAKKYIFPYSAPLTGSSLLTYVKNHLPTLILGKEFSLENVAVFSILKTFFKALHSLSGSFIHPMMSEFLDLKKNMIEFLEKMNTIFFSVLALRLAVFFFTLIFISYFFSLYKIDNNLENRYVFYFLSLEYLVAGMISIYGINLRLGNSTKKVLNASLVRFGVEVSLIYLILLDYGIVAAALILFIARSVETIVTYVYSFREGLFRPHIFLILFLIPSIYYLSFKLIE